MIEKCAPSFVPGALREETAIRILAGRYGAFLAGMPETSST
jgi:hypothetical protein